MVERVVHGVEQRQIAQQGTTVNVAPRKDVGCSSPLFPIDVGTSIPESPRVHAQVASYEMMNSSSDDKISSNQKYLL